MRRNTQSIDSAAVDSSTDGVTANDENRDALGDGFYTFLDGIAHDLRESHQCRSLSVGGNGADSFICQEEMTIARRGTVAFHARESEPGPGAEGKMTQKDHDWLYLTSGTCAHD